jgi:hypothetical protein
VRDAGVVTPNAGHARGHENEVAGMLGRRRHRTGISGFARARPKGSSVR